MLQKCTFCSEEIITEADDYAMVLLYEGHVPSCIQCAYGRRKKLMLHQFTPVCVISQHEKGFWQADIYLDCWQEGAVPDWFCTGKIGGTKQDVIARAKKNYPELRVEYFEAAQENSKEE